MPIVFIHGVATREPSLAADVETLMRRYLGGLIAGDAHCHIVYAYWGDAAAQLSWGGAARPRSPLLRQGGGQVASKAERIIATADIASALKGLPRQPEPAVDSNSLVISGRTSVSDGHVNARLADLSDDALSDLLATLLIRDGGMDGDDLGRHLIAVDEVVRDPAIRLRLATQPDLDGEWDVLKRAILVRIEAGPLITQGPAVLARIGDRLGESLGRGVGLPGFVVSRAVGEFREPINRLATLFVGDVLAYLHDRGTADAPGKIPQRLLQALRVARNAAPSSEPLVVVSHSMGGQIVYDAVTTWLLRLPEYQDIRIDFWCATASQVGLFEELKFFLASDPAVRKPQKVAFPRRDHLGAWWNVWDYNDFISYTAAPIFEGVDDESYDSGMTLVGAHGGYLQRPSFYRRLAEKLARAADGGWHR